MSEQRPSAEFEEWWYNADEFEVGHGAYAWAAWQAGRASRPVADESAKPVYQFRYLGSGDWRDVSKEEFDRLSASITAEDLRFRALYAHPASTPSKEAKPSNNAALADLLIREICEADPADPNAEDTVCIGVDDLRLIIETCAVEAENAPVASKEAVTLTYPEVLTPELREVLGWMCFQYISLAQCMRADGVEIATRAEDEQAAVLHWLTKFVLKHGADWRPHAGEALKAMRERVAQRDASKTEGQS